MGEYEVSFRPPWRSARPFILGPSFASLALVIAAITLLFSGCANVDPGRSLAEKDRFARFNQLSYNGYDRLDRAVIRPVARGYDALPQKVKGRVANFFDNLRGPIDISNNLLQGDFEQGFSGVGRLLVNSTIGLAGLFDPASRMGMPRHAEDFGQTLAVWGVPSGPYLYLPFIGPTTARDLLGIGFDWQISPITQHDDTSTRNSLVVLDLIEKRAEWLSPFAEGTLERESDPYGFVQRQYDQTREDQIYDGNAPDPFDFE